MNLLVPTERGLYCPVGDFHIDPSRAVPRAIVTHAHADHAVKGCGKYLAAPDCLPLLRHRLGRGIEAEGLEYGRSRRVRGVRISLHPAGHVLGSIQVRLECRGEVWVATGDYKRQPDPTCRPFEPVPCHVLLTETTFGLPIYVWPEADEELQRIESWRWRNRERGVSSLLLVYSLGKAQRLLASLAPDLGPIHVHDAIAGVNAAYREAGIELPTTAIDPPSAGSTVLTVPQAVGTRWLAAAAPYETAYVSGWMRTRRRRQQRGTGRGFVMSDHVDWPALMRTIRESGAERVGAMHGSTAEVVRFLREQGTEAFEVRTGRPQLDPATIDRAESFDESPASSNAPAHPSLGEADDAADDADDGDDRPEGV
ncbi:MAG TPA: ligase-associated DNA damage response exonuclease [Pirellulaceae bacterium]|nr:ligase-associated DNA damage response exonuclease [Pirellulaceae bacterium]